ncbi:hypothetical protein AAG570_005518 [Ranatra chinensis]|uniref:Signal recognition particle subunit SRP68 n=1 Tax=Ranatra chinensis TaxID=642074 RepID=A0ABD0YCN1_9HEMI
MFRLNIISRYLYIPLMLAERAWAYAMQLRQESNTEPRKKFHLISRLRKASHHAQQLHLLCQSDLCDARSKLEAQAYLAWMTGSLQFELHLWKQAMDNFQQAQMVYEKLCAAVDEVDQATYKHKCEELTPSLRYCAYNIGDCSAISDLKSLHTIAHGDILDNLESLMAKARDKQGASIREVNWRGKKLTVRPPSVGVFLLAEQELDTVLASGQEANVEILERHIMHCKDAMAAIRDEINSEQSGKQKGNTAAVAQLQDLLTYFTHIRLTRSNQRTLAMIEAAKASMLEEGRKSKPQDLIRLYEIILQNLSEMQQLNGMVNDKEYQQDIDTAMKAYKAFRCYYIAEVLTGTKRFREALVLYDKSIGYANGAEGVEPSLKEQLPPLISKVESAKCICLAQAVLQGSDEAAASSQTGDKKQASKVPLINRLDEYREDPKLLTKQPNVMKLPPDMKPIPCKPLFFDVAMNHITLPTLDEKVDKKAPPAQAGISGFVKGLWGWGSSSK